MNPEKPIWLWKSNNEFVLLELFCILLGVYFLSKIAGFFTHRYEMIQKHGKRLDRLAFRTGCTPEERKILQNFYFNLKQRHRVLLAHNHIKDFLRIHLLHFLTQWKLEAPERFLSLVSKLLDTANHPSKEPQIKEFVLLKQNLMIGFGQIQSQDLGIFSILSADVIFLSHLKTNTKIEISFFRNQRGTLKCSGIVSDKFHRTISILRLPN